jgi:hypothetical protein
MRLYDETGGSADRSKMDRLTCEWMEGATLLGVAGHQFGEEDCRGEAPDHG